MKKQLIFAATVIMLATLRLPAQTPIYYTHEGQKVPLKELTDVLASRILSNAVVAKVQTDYQDKFDLIPSVGLRHDDLAISKSSVETEVAAASIKHLQNIKEAQPLRVFTTDNGNTYLIEFPELIVQYASGTSDADAQKHIRLYSKAFRKTEVPGRYLVELETASSTIEVANAMSRRTKTPPIVDYAEPNFRIVLPMSIPSRSGACAPVDHPVGTAFPNDPYFADQWGLRSQPRSDSKGSSDIRISGAWSVTHGISSIKVAVVDEGLDLNHPDLKNKIVASWDAVMRQSGAQAQDDADHGTSAAGIIAAESNNGIGIAGVAPEAKIIGIRVAVTDANGRWITDPATIAAGIDKALSLEADVINASWGSDPSAPITDIERAIRRAYTNGRKGKGTVVVIAAGNRIFEEGSNETAGGPVSFPANMAGSTPIIAVGALSQCNELKTGKSCDGEKDWASNAGTSITVLAPGVRILTLSNQGKSTPPYTTCFRGTSSAAPFVAGAAALLLSLHSELTATEVKERIVNSADAADGDNLGYRRLNACRLVGGANCEQQLPASANK